MFYAHFVLAKKGPLARIWLAAHWDKKLTKAQVYETNIEESVQGIMQPKVKMALRTSGHLLLGVVKIYNRKAKYLLADCNEAFAKIKMAFRPGMVDLPLDKREAAINAITLPDYFQDVDTELPILEDMVDFCDGGQFMMMHMRADEITLRDDYAGVMLEDEGGMDGFDDGLSSSGGSGGSPEIMRDVPTRPGGGSGSLESVGISMDQDISRLRDAPFGDESTIGRPSIGMTGGSKDAQFGISRPMSEAMSGIFEAGLPFSASIREPDQNMTMPASPGNSQFGGGGGSRPVTPLEDTGLGAGVEESGTGVGLLTSPSLDATPSVSTGPAQPPLPTPSPAPAQHEQTTLLQNEDESFALAPIDASALKGDGRRKRKRKLVVDAIKAFTGEEMKDRLEYCGDIITTLDIAPPTKRLMRWKEIGGVDELFSQPCHPLLKGIMAAQYKKGLHMHRTDDDHFSFIRDHPGGDLQLTHISPEKRFDNEQVRSAKTKARPVVKRKRLEQLEDNSYVRRQEELVRQQEELGRELRGETISLPEQVDLMQVSGVEERLGLTDFSNMGSPGYISCPASPPRSPEGVAQSSPGLPPPSASPVHHQQQPDNSALFTLPPSQDISLPPPAKRARRSTTRLPDPLAASFASIEATTIQFDAHSFDGPIMSPGDFAPPMSPDLGDDMPADVIDEGYDYDAPAQDNNEDYSVEAREEASEASNAGRAESSGTNQVAEQSGMYEDESLEAYENRVVNKRAAQFHKMLELKFKEADNIDFSSLITEKHTRKHVAQAFYSFLVLNKHDALTGSQETIFAPIIMQQTPGFAKAAQSL